MRTKKNIRKEIRIQFSAGQYFNNRRAIKHTYKSKKKTPHNECIWNGKATFDAAVVVAVANPERVQRVDPVARVDGIGDPGSLCSPTDSSMSIAAV